MNEAVHKPGADPKVRAANPRSGRSASAEFPMGRRGKTGVPKMFRKAHITMTDTNINYYYFNKQGTEQQIVDFRK